MTPKCWDKFRGYFLSHGFEIKAPSWPGKEGSVKEQNERPDSRLAGLGIREIVDHYAEIISREAERPILIGHSFGGLFVQMLLDRGLGAAGIAIDSVSPKGVFNLYPTVLKGMSFPLFVPAGWKKIIRISQKRFAYAFIDKMSGEDQARIYNEEVVPETGRIFWQAALAPFNDLSKINFANDKRAPMLIVAGSEDKIVPAKVNFSNYKKYIVSKARTDFKEFPGRTHYIIGGPGWEEVAGYCLEWLKGL